MSQGYIHNILTSEDPRAFNTFGQSPEKMVAAWVDVIPLFIPGFR